MPFHKILILLLFPLFSWSQDLDQLYLDLAQQKPTEFSIIQLTNRENFLSSNSYIQAMGILDSEMVFYSARQTEAVQTAIDKVTIKIFQSQGRMQAFCTVLGDHPLTHKNLLGLSEKAAHVTADLCAKMLGGQRDNSERRYKFPKRYVFVFNVPESHPLQSWTNFSNETYIFFESQLSEPELAARILHELAIMTDAKQGLSMTTFPMLMESYGFKAYSKNGNLDENIQRLVLGHSVPLIRFAFAIVRAAAVEEIILKQIYGTDVMTKISNPELFKLIQKTNYRGAVELVMRESLPYQRFHLSLEHSILYPALGDQYFEKFYLKESQISEVLNNLEKFDLYFKHKKFLSQEYNTRQWLTLPMIGPESIFYTRGPRPRVGGGWGNSAQKKASSLTKPPNTSGRVDVLLNFKNQIPTQNPQNKIESAASKSISEALKNPLKKENRDGESSNKK